MFGVSWSWTTGIKHGLKMQRKELLATIEAAGRKAGDSEMLKIDELLDQIATLQMQAESLAYQIHNATTTTSTTK